MNSNNDRKTSRRDAALKKLGLEPGSHIPSKWWKPRIQRHRGKTNKSVDGWLDKRLQYHSCTSKIRYRNQSDARDAAKTAYRLRGTKLRAYRCEFCNGWHLTKQRAENETIKA